MTEPTKSSPSQAEGSISKQAAVAQAVAALGNDAPRAQLQAYIQERFGMTIAPDHISAAKSQLKAAAAAAKKKETASAAAAAPAPAAVAAAPAAPAAKKPAPKQLAKKPAKATPAAKPQAPAAPANAKANTVPLDDVLAVQGLVERLGPGPLRTLIDAFSRQSR